MVLVGFALGHIQAARALQPLDIALTNDDGWQAVGIQHLRHVLTEAGQRVTLAAPLDQQSGSSAAVNAEKLVVVRKARDQFATAVCTDGV